MSMWDVEGVRRRERRRRQGREAWVKGLKVARKVVIVWIGMDILVVVVVVVEGVERFDSW
jgi:hypothetical protein